MAGKFSLVVVAVAWAAAILVWDLAGLRVEPVAVCELASAEPVVWEGEIARPPAPAAGGRRLRVRLRARIVDGQRQSATGVVAVFEEGAGAPLLAGDVVRFRARLHAPRGYRNPGAVNRAASLAADGIACIGTAAEPGVVATGAHASGPWRWASALRARAAAGLGAADGDGGGLAVALVTGDVGRLRPDVVDAFRRAGLAHLLAFSGMQLAALALVLFALVRRAWARTPFALALWPETVAAAVALPCTALVALASGAEIPALRALAVVGIVVAGSALGRRTDGWTVLAAAALAVLVPRPSALFEASFQLSFAAAAALVASARGHRHPLVSLAIASLAAQAATLPVSAHHFGEVPLTGVLANLVAVPYTTFVVFPVSVAAAVCPPLAPLADVAAEGLVRLATLFAAHTVTWDAPLPGLAGGAVVAAILWWLARPGRAASLAVVAAMCAWAAMAHARERAPESVTISFLDVGQGDGAVVRTPAGQRWLVDSGGQLFGADTGRDPGARAVLPFLRHAGVDRLDLVIVSHGHPDHVGGLAAVAARVPITEVWVPRRHGSPAFTALLAELERRGTRVVIPAVGTVRRDASGAELRVHGPDAGGPPWWSENDASLVVELTYAGRRVLFAGDIEEEAEAELPVPRVDVVKVPHHGSATSSTAPFVAATRPAIAVISCGEDNPFRFPAAAVVARWRAAGARVLRIDEVGAVCVTITPDGRLSANPC